MADSNSSPQRMKELNKLSKTALIELVMAYEPVIANLDETANFYVRNIGRLCRVFTRFSRGYIGPLWSVRFKLEEIELATETTEYEAGSGKRYREVKTVRVPASNLVQFEFIEEREEQEEPEDELSDTLKDVEGILSNG